MRHPTPTPSDAPSSRQANFVNLEADSMNNKAARKIGLSSAPKPLNEARFLRSFLFAPIAMALLAAPVRAEDMDVIELGDETMAVESASAERAFPQTGAGWTTAGGTPQGTRFSGLTDITPLNAGKLVEEFSYPTGTKGSHQGSPLVVGNKMYIVTPFPNKLIAVSLSRPGTALWTFNPNPAGFSQGLTCCDIVNRGPVYANGLVIYTLLDGNVVAVNARTGAQVWRTKVADPWLGETLNTAPIVVRDKVIFGSSGSEMGVRGSVRALNINTGRLVWRAYATGPDTDVLIDSTFRPYFAKDRGANLGVSTWPTNMWRHGGATSWAWITYDPALNLIFYGTSQPGTFNPDMRPGDNKWGATIFARNPDTGKAAWAYQLVPHDSWDYDAVNENTVVDLTVNGVVRKVIVHFDKNGFAYTLDRATGALISAKSFSFVNWASGIDLTTGLPRVAANKLTHEGVVTNNICPSAIGAKDWEYSAFSPLTKLFYFGAHNMCMSYEAFKVTYIAGTPMIGANLAISPGPGGNMGEFVAFDPVRGVRAWAIREPYAVFGGALATAGGVVFYGTLDKKFKAIDARTGRLLLSKQLECGIASAPITFKGPDGKQRVAITTGIGFLNGGFVGGPCPAGTTFSTAGPALAGASVDLGANEPQSERVAATSGYVHVFKLP
ncbi:PQQ-dependent dehydrogenase, methanol/ethanol family [Methylocystis sp. ATCC 49242]|uniref:PQQ-dependent dehydrogenase, methanol/ethanol family n=1 Tax=Methylocystis sp. ATCC 49242 TaxID=622637 RepID=UPI000A043C18|nr:PQQ-dependent dehydrogenase, methanol/ethanol family [Methylocystis sp. ATCC 49242]